MIYLSRTYNKYKNIKILIDGVVFSSKKEGHRYSVLKLLKRGGEISELQLQPRFELLKGGTDRFGKKYKGITYVADFMYKDRNGDMWVEDCKGMRTEVYKLKRKLFIARYPQYIFIEL